VTHDRAPWERLDAETNQAWDGFSRYRDLPPGQRSLSRLASDMVTTDPTDPLSKPQRKGTPRSVRTDLARWSSKHHWVDRVAAWDREQDRQRLEDNRHLNREMNERHLELAVAGLDLATKPVTALLQQIDADPAYFDTMTPSEHLQWCDRMLKHISGLAALERQARESSVADARRITSGTTDGIPAYATTVWLGDLFEALVEAGVEPPVPPPSDAVPEASETDPDEAEESSDDDDAA
jgi:hypothetical protein